MAQGYNQSVESPTQPTFNRDRFVCELRSALQRELPGPAAQQKMAAPQRPVTPLSLAPPRRSAVLALLHPAADGIALFFTERTNSLRHHAGQISFPGGGAETQDRTLKDTALRETEEELGFPTGAVDILGMLTPLFIAPSHNIVHPFVGWLPAHPPLHPDPAEVSAVLTVPVDTLLDPATLSSCEWWLDGRQLTAPCFLVEKATIWGATAMMLSELLEVIQSLPAVAYSKRIGSDDASLEIVGQRLSDLDGHQAMRLYHLRH